MKFNIFLLLFLQLLIYFFIPVNTENSFLSKEDVTSLFLSAHNFSSPSNHHSSNFLKVFFEKLESERLKIDQKFIKDTDFENLFEKSKKLFTSTLHYLKTPAPDSRAETAAACKNGQPIEVLKSLRDSLDENSLLKASFRYYFSTESIKALENTIKIFAEQLLISEGLCLSFEEVDKSTPKSDKATIDELSTIIEEIHQLVSEQDAKSKDLYFPDAAEKVVKQFLSHYSSESFVYFSSEIKSFNEKVAKDLVEYLNNFYRGINKFAAGVNRADHLLIGKLPANSVIQVKWAGWSVFVYRSSLASSFLPIETNIHEIIAAAAETDLCKDLTNLNETLSKVFDAIDGVCENFEFCGIWPYSNSGEGLTDGNLGIERHSLCHSVKFNGFTVYFGLNEDPDGSPIVVENVESYDIFRKKLIENVQDEIKAPSKVETSDAAGDKPYRIHDLKYTPGLQKLPIEFGDEVHLLKENGFEESEIKNSASGLHMVSFFSLFYLFFALLLAFYW